MSLFSLKFKLTHTHTHTHTLGNHSKCLILGSALLGM